MAEATKTADAAEGDHKTADNVDLQKQASTLVETIDKIGGRLDTIDKRQEDLAKEFEEAKKTQYPAGAPYIRKGESVMTSRPYSMMRLAISCRKRLLQERDWNSHAKVELGLSDKLKKEYEAHGYVGSGELVPLGADLMPTRPTKVVDDSGQEQELPGLPVELVKECRDVMRSSLADFDTRELDYLEKKGHTNIRKDMSANVATTGGTFVAFAAQGELIDMLRGVEVMSRAGAQEIDLPPQGSIRFPRVTSGITVSAYAENTTLTESTPGTGHLLLQAKAYSGYVDIPDELMKFSTSVAVESWLRGEFVKDIGLKIDADMIAGTGGIGIQGATMYSGARTVIASTVAAQGDTLEAWDPGRLLADIADQNAPVDSGFFYAMRNTLWDALTNRRADAIAAADSLGPFMFASANQAVGTGAVRKVLNGHQVITSTQVPVNRTKGAATTLTMVFGGVGSQWIIARSGVVDFAMTDSDGSKFLNRLSTMRGTMYCDAGPRTEASFGMIDDLLNA